LQSSSYNLNLKEKYTYRPYITPYVALSSRSLMNALSLWFRHDSSTSLIYETASCCRVTMFC